MTVLLCSNLLSGTTGLDKSVVMTANTLHRAGYHVLVLNFLGATDGSSHILSRWSFAPGIAVQPLRTLPAAGGRLLHRGYHPVLSGRVGAVTYRFSENELGALREINAAMAPDDTIIFSHPLQALALQKALRGEPHRPRTVLQVHGDYLSATTDLWDTMLEGRAVIDRVQTVADQMRDQFFSVFAPEDVVWIPNVQESAPVAAQQHDGVEIAVVGSFQMHKNQEEAVRALALLPDPSIRLTLWGNHETAYGRSIKDLVESLGLGDRVRMPGVGTEAQIYGSADLVVMPSLSEGFPYVLSEATCHGLPVVAYDFDFGPRDAIIDGESGFIVPHGDTDALADRLRRLAADPQMRTRFGRAARALYERKLSPGRAVASYQEMLGQPTVHRLDLDQLFPASSEPIDAGDIAHRFQRLGQRRQHLITVRSRQRLHDLRADNGTRTRRLRSVRLPGRTVIVLSAQGNEVISFATTPGAEDRHYLANTSSKNTLEVLPYLRRDAAPAVLDVIHVPIGRQPAHRRIERHPRYPIIGGQDNFGEGLNQPGGVAVVNNGSALAPIVTISGEYDSVTLRDARSERQVAAPFGYGELFERLCAAERDHGLFEITTPEGVHAWEVYRAALIGQLCEALGIWGRHFTPGVEVSDVYAGRKRLSAAPPARRVVFEFPRKSSDIDPRTSRFVDDDTMVVSYPQISGYSAQVRRSDRVFPIYEYHLWRRSSRRPHAGPVDPRPFEEALSGALELDVVLGDQLRSRVQKFLDEREFWTPVFEHVQPEEVVIPSAHWSAGIVAAAERAGARTADVQYALTGRYHPSYWFGDRPRHGAQRLYSWSSFWSPRVNGYQSTAVVPRHMPEVDRAASLIADGVLNWDVCVVSQPRVFRRIVAFVANLIRERPELSVVVAPHPDERHMMEAKLAGLGLHEKVAIATASTMETMARSAMVVGGYSTSLYESAFLGKPTYVLPVPGHELTLQDLRSGLFRLAGTPADLVEYPVPPHRERIFEGVRGGVVSEPA